MNKLLRAPYGWKKGEPLVIEKKMVHGELAWYISQPLSFNYDEDIPFDAIASMWFYTWDEFELFIKWWNDKK